MFSRRKRPTKKIRRRRTAIGFQHLEDRRLLAGDDQISEAIPISLYTTEFGEIDNFDDVDMYVISMTGGQQIGIDIDVPDFSLDPGLRVFDASGNELADSDDDLGPGIEFSELESFVVFEAPVTGDYFIGVSTYDNFSYDPITGEDDADGDTTGYYELIIDDPPIIFDFVVDTIGDLPDTNPGDGTAMDANGNTSFRAAIEESNAVASGNAIASITFDIDPADEDPTVGRFVTKPLTPLPAINQAVVIDTFDLSATNSPPFQVDGSLVTGANTDGLVISAFNAKVYGLAITNFPGDGVQFDDAGESDLFYSTVFGNGGNGIRASDSFNLDIIENDIFGNGKSGILAVNGSGGLTIFDNVIGFDEFATNEGGLPAGNGVHGVHLLSGFNNVIENTIVANGSIGIAVTNPSASNNIIQGNLVGNDGTADTTLGNGSFGVLIKSPDNEIGSQSSFGTNVISGNARSGLVISDTAANNNMVINNRVGTDATGTVAVPNGAYGILVTGGANNTIGGPSPDDGNTISGNTGSGIALSNLANGNAVQNNLIGLQSNANQALPNGGVGVYVRANAFDNDVLDNFIAGNAGSQVSLVGGATVDNVFQGNMIGFGEDFAVIPGGGAGMAIRSPNNLIGGPNPGDENFISGSSTGISLAGLSAKNNTIEGNFIGTSLEFPGNDFGVTTGVLFTQGARDNTIGPNNTIANSSTDAIRSVSGGAGNTFTQNSIFNNGFGIDLAGNGQTANDAGDSDTGPNLIQNNASSLVAIAALDGSLEIESVSFDYTVDSDPANAAYPLTVEFFVSQGGQGVTYVANDVYTESDFAAGSKSVVITSFANTFPLDPEFGTATVTDANGNTSEFSVEVPIVYTSGGGGNSGQLSGASNPLDVNLSGDVTAVDALIVLNHMNSETTDGESTSAYKVDTNGDGEVTGIDALLIINHLNDAVETQIALALLQDDDEDEDFDSDWDLALSELLHEE